MRAGAVDVYKRQPLRYRVLRDISRRTTATTVLGHPLSMPVIVAPTAFHKLAHPDGEVATVRAAGSAGTLITLISVSYTHLDVYKRQRQLLFTSSNV